MRRNIIIGVALAVLTASGVASAASDYNSYSASKLVITPAKAGSKAKPVGLGMTQILKVAGPKGKRAAPLIYITFKIYGVKLDAGKLPVCTGSMILKRKESPLGGCPKGSLIANGALHSLLGPASDPSGKGTPCNPHLNLFNGGPKKQVDYFYTNSANDCGTLHTGATAPWEETISYSGGYAIIKDPLPADIGTKVASIPGLYSSLISERLVFPKTVGGRRYMVGVGCQKGKRPWSITYTARLYSGGNETQTVRGSSPC